MVRCLVLALSTVLLAADCTFAVVRLADQSPVYSVADVRARLAHDPQAWVGRTVQVRGVFGACDAWLGFYGPCMSWQGLVDPGASVRSPVLSLTPGDPPPLLASLRRLPFLGDLMPAPPVLQRGAVATYRVQLQAMAGSVCGTGICVEAVLLDAAP